MHSIIVSLNIYNISYICPTITPNPLPNRDYLSKNQDAMLLLGSIMKNQSIRDYNPITGKKKKKKEREREILLFRCGRNTRK